MDGNSVPHGCLIALCWVRGLRIGLDWLSHRHHTWVRGLRIGLDRLRIGLDRLRIGLGRLAVRHTWLLHRLRISLLHRLRISLMYHLARLAIACECFSM